MAAVVQNVVSNQMVDTAIGPISVAITNVTDFDIDDHVQTTIVSIATAIKMYNIGVTVGGY